MARPKLPKSTRINGQRWRIVPRRQVYMDGDECDGVCHYDRHVIEISIASDEEHTIMSAYFHEVLHAVLDPNTTGIHLTEDQEHVVIANVERWLAANCDLRKTPRKPKLHGSKKKEREPKLKRARRGR